MADFFFNLYLVTEREREKLREWREINGNKVSSHLKSLNSCKLQAYILVHRETTEKTSTYSKTL